MRRSVAAALALLFVGCILLANFVTSRYGMVPVGFGLTATAGTYLAGLSFVIRDSLQDLAGKLATLGVIAAGAALSYFVASPFIALASGLAFAASEVADLAIYTPLRRRGYLRAAAASNLVGALVDTLLFLSVAGFGLTREGVAGQMVGKLAVTALMAVLVVGSRRALLRQPVRGR